MQLGRKNFIVIDVVGDLSWTVASEFLPPVGSKLRLIGPPDNYEVIEIEFCGAAMLASYTNITGKPDLTIPEDDVLIPVLKVAKIKD